MFLRFLAAEASTVSMSSVALSSGRGVFVASGARRLEAMGAGCVGFLVIGASGVSGAGFHHAGLFGFGH